MLPGANSSDMEQTRTAPCHRNPRSMIFQIEPGG